MPETTINTEADFQDFVQRFQKDLNRLLEMHMCAKDAIEAPKVLAIRKTILSCAGYLEAQSIFGSMRYVEMGFPVSNALLERESCDEIYEDYTHGFNLGFRVAHQHVEQITEQLRGLAQEQQVLKKLQEQVPP